MPTVQPSPPPPPATSPPPAVALRVTDATRAFGSVQALAGVSLELGRGELLGLLGPNGAGKTTLIRAIAGRVRLDRGSVEIPDGRGPGGRETLGIVPQEIALYPLLTARENLEAFGSLHGVRGPALRDRVAWALEWTALGDRAREPIGRFSGGMKRRLNIACGVLHRPGVVLLDEPTVGVDPQSRERIHEMLDGLRRDGASLLLTTHQLDEAQARCDRIVIVDHGRVIAAGTLAELVAHTTGEQRQVLLRLDRAPAAPLPGLESDDHGTRLRGTVGDLASGLPALIRQVEEAGCRVEDVEVHRPSLHSVFLHLTGRELRE